MLSIRQILLEYQLYAPYGVQQVAHKASFKCSGALEAAHVRFHSFLQDLKTLLYLESSISGPNDVRRHLACSKCIIQLVSTFRGRQLPEFLHAGW